jgi:hypothetical protein
LGRIFCPQDLLLSCSILQTTSPLNCLQVAVSTSVDFQGNTMHI